MANSGDLEEEVTDYIFESRTLPDGKIVKITKSPAGVIVSEDLMLLERVIESKSFDHRTGVFTKRTVYEWDDQRKPLRTTSYDSEGDIILTQARGCPPVTGELYRGEKPFHIYPKKKRAQPGATAQRL